MKALFYAPILVLLASCASTKLQSTRPELAGVYGAARSIEGALAVGVTYQDFSTLVREFSKELLLARDQARYNPAPKFILSTLDKYSEMLIMYKDSEQVWNLEIQQKRDDPVLKDIAGKYGVADAIGGYWTNFEVIRQTIWERASKLHEQQIAIVYGYTPKS